MISLSHILRMTDTIGIFEHCTFAVPDPAEGYTTDDNARALQLMHKLNNTKLIPVYSSFLSEASTKKGFHNDRKADGTWDDRGGVGDWFGRAMIALTGTPLFEEKLPLIKTVRSFHTIALLLEAVCQRSEKDRILPLRKYPILLLAGILVDAYKKHTDGSWHWFEHGLTYESAQMPKSLLIAYQKTGNVGYRDVGLGALDFLISQTFDKKRNVFSFIGNEGWYPAGGKKALYVQQPVEAAAMVEALCMAYTVTHNKKYQVLARRAFAWYEGENIVGLSLLDPATGGVFDGLYEGSVNLNQGAESVITYGLAYCALRDMV